MDSYFDGFDEIAEWQRGTFGTSLTPEAAASRLKKELHEFLLNPCGDEAADCVITAIDLFRSIGVLYPSMFVEDKHATNEHRKWNVAPDGTGQHVEE